VKKLHYFLVCGQVVFHTKDGETGQVMLNAVVTNDSRNVPARLIGKAQQALQLHFFKQLEDPTNTVLDVVIHAFSHLGNMTEKEFHHRPDNPSPAVNNPFADGDGKPSTVVDLTADMVN
jgi:hypothetical protein